MRVVVTGSEGDIGKAICSFLEDKKIEVVCGTRRNCDVTSRESVEAFMADAWADGAVDGLVNCHGAPGCIKPTVFLMDEEFEKVISIDLTGTLRTCRAAARYMLAQGYGSIVNISSIHALATYPERAAYASAKAGVVGLTKALAVEWGRAGVRVNAVLPGQVMHTERTKRVMCLELMARSPGSPPRASEVASAAHFLIETRGISGHSLVVDGGWLASAWFKSHDES